MGSKNLDVRKKQLARAEARMAQRKAELEGRGLDAAAVSKDPVLRHLAADVRKAKQRVEAPQAAKAHVEKVAAKIAKQGKKKPGAKKPKKPKQAAPAAGGGGGKKGGGKKDGGKKDAGKKDAGKGGKGGKKK